MSPDQQRVEAGDCRPQPATTQPRQQGGMFPLHRLPNICCSSGACCDVEFWPMGCPQAGWLQLDTADHVMTPVDLFAFSGQCLGVSLIGDVPLQLGSPALLMLQAHGAGLRHRPVRLCWHRPHPRNLQQQCVGLRFEPIDQPSPHTSAAGVPRLITPQQRGPLATSPAIHHQGAAMASDAVHQLKQLIHSNPDFAQALSHIETTEQAAELSHQHGLEISPETLWRHRGTLLEGGRPTWRG